MVEHHISGQLKVAPEHISDNVLQMMGKPENAVYEKFINKYKKLNEKMGKKQFVVPYLMSSHPGSKLEDAIALAEYLRDLGYMPEQVQDFYPTPSTISTCMYYTGLDPRTMKPVYVPINPHEKAMQRALIQYRNPKNYDLVHEALVKAGRTDLIGFDKNCLIRPRKNYGSSYEKYGNSSKTNVSTDNKNNKNNKNSHNQISHNQNNNHKNSGNKGNNKSYTHISNDGMNNKNTINKNKNKKKTIRNVHKNKHN